MPTLTCFHYCSDNNDDAGSSAPSISRQCNGIFVPDSKRSEIVTSFGIFPIYENFCFDSIRSEIVKQRVSTFSCPLRCGSPTTTSTPTPMRNPLRMPRRPLASDAPCRWHPTSTLNALRATTRIGASPARSVQRCNVHPEARQARSWCVSVCLGFYGMRAFFARIMLMLLLCMSVAFNLRGQDVSGKTRFPVTT